MSRETATDKEHARHDLLREVRRLKHALSSANTRVRRLRGLYRDAEARARTAESRRLERDLAHNELDDTRAAWRTANLRALLAEARACVHHCPFRRMPR